MKYIFLGITALLFGVAVAFDVHAQPVCPPDWHFSPPCSEYVPPPHGDWFPPEHEVQSTPHSVPEPGTLLLVGTGLVALVRRRRK